MGIDAKHPAYGRYIERWLRCRHVSEGGDAVKARKDLYLPRLSGQRESDYNAYLQRALWYGATSRTIQGLSGAVFRKDPAIEVPVSVETLLDSITDDNLDFISLAQEVTREQLTTGRIGLLVDLPSTEGAQPYISRYNAEDIINWRTETVEGKERLTLVVLAERVEVEGQDEYELQEKTRFRVLRLRDGQYIQEEWEENGKAPAETYEPKRLGVRLDFIPFRIVNAVSLGAMPEKPPLIDVVDVNLSHYRTSADLEHGAHFTALPTPWLAGFPVDKAFAIGSGVAFVTDNVQAKAGMLEFTGKGLDALRDMKSDKERLMAVLGARLLEEQRKGVEAADTVRLRSSGESGALANIVKTASRGLTDVLQWVVWWKGAAIEPVADDVSCELNTDFLNERISAQELTALFGVLQGGAISLETWLYNLERGEMLPPGSTIEDEADRIMVQAGAADAG